MNFPRSRLRISSRAVLSRHHGGINFKTQSICSSACEQAIMDVIRHPNKSKLYTRLCGVSGISLNAITRSMQLLLLEKDFTNVSLTCEVLRLNSAASTMVKNESDSNTLSTSVSSVRLRLTEPMVYASVRAHGYLCEVEKAERLVRSMQSLFIGGSSPPELALEALLHCYCVNGRIAAAESLLLAWIHTANTYALKVVPRDDISSPAAKTGIDVSVSMNTAATTPTTGDATDTTSDVNSDNVMKNANKRYTSTGLGSGSGYLNYVIDQQIKVAKGATVGDSARKILEQTFVATKFKPVGSQTLASAVTTPPFDVELAANHHYIHSIMLHLGGISTHRDSPADNNNHTGSRRGRGPTTAVWRDMVSLYCQAHMWKQCVMVAEYLRGCDQYGDGEDDSAVGFATSAAFDRHMFNNIAGCLVECLQFEQLQILLMDWPEHSLDEHTALITLRALTQALNAAPTDTVAHYHLLSLATSVVAQVYDAVLKVLFRESMSVGVGKPSSVPSEGSGAAVANSNNTISTHYYSSVSSALLMDLVRLLVATGYIAQAVDTVVALHRGAGLSDLDLISTEIVPGGRVVVDPRVIGYLIQLLTAADSCKMTNAIQLIGEAGAAEDDLLHVFGDRGINTSADADADENMSVDTVNLDRAIMLYTMLTESMSKSSRAERHANVPLQTPVQDEYLKNLRFSYERSADVHKAGSQENDYSMGASVVAVVDRRGSGDPAVYSNCNVDELCVHLPQSYHYITAALLRLYRSAPTVEARGVLAKKLDDFVTYQAAHDHLDVHMSVPVAVDTETDLTVNHLQAFPEDKSWSECKIEETETAAFHSAGGIGGAKRSVFAGNKPKSIRRTLQSDPLFSSPLRSSSSVADVDLDTAAFLSLSRVKRKPPKELDRYSQMLNRRIQRRIAMRQEERASSATRVFEHMYGVDMRASVNMLSIIPKVEEDNSSAGRMVDDPNAVNVTTSASASTNGGAVRGEEDSSDSTSSSSSSDSESPMTASIENKLEKFATYLTSKF